MGVKDVRIDSKAIALIRGTAVEVKMKRLGKKQVVFYI